MILSSSIAAFVPTIQPSTVQEAEELVSILRSDFYGSEPLEGPVTTLQRTLVSEGSTTVWSTAVEGSLLEGEYVQLVSTGSTVHGQQTSLEPGFLGSAELTELPTLGFEEGQQPERSEDQDSRADKARESLEEDRKSANLSFKERLKQRFQKFREEHGSVLVREPSFRDSSYGRAIGDPRQRGKDDDQQVSFGRKSDAIRKKLREVLNYSKEV